MKHKNTHIVYIVTKLELGGAQKVCLSLFQHFSQTDNASLITGSKGPLVPSVQNKKNVYLINDLTREVSFFAIFKELICFIKLVFLLRKLKRQYRNIIVHTHSTKAGLVVRWAAFFAGIKTRVHTIHGFAFHNHQNKLKWLVIYTLELITSFITTHFICVSSYDVKVGIKLFPFFTNKHSIIRAAVDKQFFTLATKTSSFPVQHPFIFGTVACFKPQKNLFDLLKAFASVYKKNNNTRLEIIGDGTLRTDIEKWIQKHQLSNGITLHGWQQNVRKKMLLWHSFVLSSLWEGLPCAVVEARLLKLPVISYDTGGITDIIEHNKNGLIYPQKDWKSLALGMIELSSNQHLYDDLQKTTESLVDFTTKNMLEFHDQLYENKLL